MAKQSTPVITIGSKESVDFPDFGVRGVPAKVDTGADSSAIWASDIRESKNKLSFCLFDRSSPFYTGETITATHYSVASIKNSFGHTEFRYKVSLGMTIAGRTIKVRFTLANRANNNYPILIGRRTLSGKFLVDVSRGHDLHKPYQVLILTPNKSQRMEEFAQGVTKSNRDLQITLAVYSDLQFIIGKACQVVLAGSVQDIARFDLVHFKSSPREKLDVVASAARYLQKRKIPFIDRAVETFSGNSKLYQYAVLQNNDIDVPPSVFVSLKYLKNAYKLFTSTLGSPFVLKDVRGMKGRDNYLIASEKEFKKIADQMIQRNVQVIAQKYIDNEGDYRVLIFARKIQLVVRRERLQKDTHLNNVSQGGKATLVPIKEIPAKVQRNSIMAAMLLNREISGVDMVQDQQTGAWYCLEVNEDPQISSGAFMDDKLKAYGAYIESEIEK